MQTRVFLLINLHNKEENKESSKIIFQKIVFLENNK